MDFKVGSLQEKSAMVEAAKERYHLVTGKSGRRWLYPDNDHPADGIHAEGGPNSEGYGGSTLYFTLVDDTIVSLKGPWHSNSDSLFKDTDIDIRDKCRTFCVIGDSGEHEKGSWSTLPLVKNVIYKDDEFQISNFHRGDWLAQLYANMLQKPVFAYCQSNGGSHSGMVEPDLENEVWKAFKAIDYTIDAERFVRTYKP